MREQRSKIDQESLMTHQEIIDAIRWGFQNRCGVDFATHGEPWTITEPEAQDLLSMVDGNNRTKLGLLYQAFNCVFDDLKREANDLFFSPQEEVLERVQAEVKLQTKEKCKRERRTEYSQVAGRSDLQGVCSV